MSWSREEALTDPAVRDPMMFVSEFRFRLRDIPTEITVRLYRPLHSGTLVVRRSHDLSIPELGPAAATEETESEGNGHGEGETLHRAIRELVVHYNAARAQGLQPDVSWLKPNQQFC